MVNAGGSRRSWFISWGGGVLLRDLDTEEIVGAVGVSNRTEPEDHDLASERPHHWHVH